MLMHEVWFRWQDGRRLWQLQYVGRASVRRHHGFLMQVSFLASTLLAMHATPARQIWQQSSHTTAAFKIDICTTL